MRNPLKINHWKITDNFKMVKTERNAVCLEFKCYDCPLLKQLLKHCADLIRKIMFSCISKVYNKNIKKLNFKNTGI